MKHLLAASVTAVAVVGLAAGCGSSSDDSSHPTTPTAGVRVPGPSAETKGLHTAESVYGRILVDGTGRTLYLLTADQGGTSTCYAECAALWPPDTQSGTPSGDVDSAKAGTTNRTDNTSQVTYNGHPLYRYAKDTKPGDTHGQGIATFGGTWYVVAPDGNPVTTAPSPTPGPSGRY